MFTKSLEELIRKGNMPFYILSPEETDKLLKRHEEEKRLSNPTYNWIQKQK